MKNPLKFVMCFSTAHIGYAKAIKEDQPGKRLSTLTRSAKDTIGCGDWTRTETVYTLRR